jgi:hypothetical protein
LWIKLKVSILVNSQRKVKEEIFWIRSLRRDSCLRLAGAGRGRGIRKSKIKKIPFDVAPFDKLRAGRAGPSTLLRAGSCGDSYKGVKYSNKPVGVVRTF